MPIRFYILRDLKTMKESVIRVEGDTNKMPVFVNPSRPNEPKDELSKEDQEIRKRKPA